MTAPLSYAEAFAEICQNEGRLSERLGKLSAIIARYGPSFSEAYDRLVKRFELTLPSECTPAVGSSLPDFLLPDQYGRLRRLHEFLSDGPLVVSFNRGHWCEYCQLELRAFTAAHREFAQRRAKVISIMPERIEYTRKLSLECRDTFPILTDMDNAYAMQLDLVVWLGEEVTRLLKSDGLDLDRCQGNGMGFVPVPATFVTDAGGTIRFRHIDPDFRRRAEIEAVIAAVEIARQS